MVKQKLPTLETQKYDNCSVFSPSGQLMFRCSQKKLEWYLTRNLAQSINDKSIQLTFTPKGNGHVTENYYLEDRINQCVVCGESETGLTLHHVVPYLYRKWMPEFIKDHSCHDALLLCVTCHDSYEPHAHRVKLTYADKYKIAIEGGPYISFPERKSVVSACRALKSKQRGNIPPDRVKQLEEIIKHYFHTDDITVDTLEKGANLALLEKAPDFKEHGQVVMESMSLDEIISFVRFWRHHFLDYTKPQFLSPTWLVENPVVRT